MPDGDAGCSLGKLDMFFFSIQVLVTGGVFSLWKFIELYT